MSRSIKALVVLLVAVITQGGYGLLFAASQTLENGLESLTQRITSGMDQAGMQYFAVPDFTDLDGRTSELGVFISEELLTRLYDTQRFKIVERRLLNKVMLEHQLGLSGLLDEKTVKEIGKILGVDALCIGTITDLRDTFKVNARMVSVETGQVFSVAAVEINKNDALRILMRKYTQAQKKVEILEQQRCDPEDYNLLVNGGFKNQYTGWNRQIGDMRQGNSKTEIIDYKEGRSGKVLHIHHEGQGHIQFSQIVPVPTADLIFSATFQGSPHEGMMKAFSGTGVVQVALQYFDHRGTKLGQSALLTYIKNPFADTPLIGVPRRQSDTYEVHYIELSPHKLYQDYRIDIRKEIEDNLLGVNPDSVEEIAVIIWCGANHAQAGAEMWVTDVRLTHK